MKRMIVSCLVVAVTAVANLLVMPPAHAATTGNVYVVVRDRVCAGYSTGGKVRGILASINKTNYRQLSWDMGDNISYPKVKFRTLNQFSAQVRCYKKVFLFWQEIGTRPVVGKFTPTKSKQTFWVG